MEGNLPNGLACAPRVFTIILKPVLATLHSMGHISLAHIDDCYLQGQTYEKCVFNVTDTFIVLDGLVFVIHPVKSILKPNCVIPNWSTQSWYAKAFHMMTKEPIYIKASKDLLILPRQPQEIHLIWEKMNFMIRLLLYLGKLRDVRLIKCCEGNNNGLLASRYSKIVQNLLR